MDVKTFPAAGEMHSAFRQTPERMRPSRVPYAVVVEQAISAEHCDTISREMAKQEAYTHRGCGALTRESENEPCLYSVEYLARAINEAYFGMLLDPGNISWMQTYEVGGTYQRHMDASPGQSRKMTAVVLLTDPAEYAGGDLTLYVTPRVFVVPRSRGTIAVFPGWLEHDVSKVVYGQRQTINMGFWGPPFA